MLTISNVRDAVRNTIETPLSIDLLMECGNPENRSSGDYQGTS